ncbi:MAG TPA: carotenoid 1,2-hydratase [Steroidobacteraceae bacterium]|nr:carotenoid 1,2-hydratase [Steroidobacteraceae bacterium]
MTERGAHSLRRGVDFLQIGPSALLWRDDALVISLRETGFPWPVRIRGEIRLHPSSLPGCSWPLDGAAKHWWTPLAPLARVEVDLDSPRQRWSGAGYLDSNAGEEPLEQGFDGWHWSRTGLRRNTAVLYDVMRRDGSRLALALDFDASGRVEPFSPPPLRSLGRSAWRLHRYTRCEPAGTAHITHRLLDTPFYARSMITTQLQGQPVRGIHESLSLQRFSSPLIQVMLPFRMPRRTRPDDLLAREVDDRGAAPRVP